MSVKIEAWCSESAEEIVRRLQAGGVEATLNEAGEVYLSELAVAQLRGAVNADIL